MKKIGIYTRAYNAEKTIVRTVESVLNQTYQNFVYILRDNGSTDATKEIIQDYAENDRKIIYQRNEENTINICKDPMQIARENDCDYFCWLDADDVYHPTFFEEMVGFAEKEELDIVVGGFTFIYPQKERNVQRIPPIAPKDSVVLTNQNINRDVLPLLPFMRQLWGKIYSMALFTDEPQKYLEEHVHSRLKSRWGSDTAVVLFLMQKAQRIGMIGKSFTDYYVSEGSSTRTNVEEGRYDNILILREFYADFLAAKKITNKEAFAFIEVMQFADVRENIILLLNNPVVPVGQKYRICEKIFSDKKTVELFLFSRDNSERKKQLCRLIEIYFDKHKMMEKQYSRLISLMGYLERLVDAGFWDKSNRFRNLFGDDADFYLQYPGVVLNTLAGNFAAATQALTQVKPESIQERFQERYLLVANNLAALDDNMPEYVDSKKQLIAYYMAQQAYEKACLTLDDFDKLLPDDEDFRNFRRALQSI